MLHLLLLLLFAPQGDAFQQGTEVPDCIATASSGV